MKKILALILFLVATSLYGSCTALNPSKIFDGEHFKNQSGFILIRGGSISSVNAKKIPRDCLLTDIHSYTLIPGLIDTHSLIFANDITFGYDYSKGLMHNTFQSKKERNSIAQNKLISYLKSGFTAVRDLGNSGRYLDAELKKELDQSKYPKFYVSGPGISSIGGQFIKGTKKRIVIREYDILENSSDIKRFISDRVLHGVDQVKLYADNDPNPSRLDREILKELVTTSRNINLRTAIHAIENQSISDAIFAAPNSIQHAFYADLNQLKLMEQKSIFLVPTDIGKDLYDILILKLSGAELTSFIRYAKYMNKVSEKRIQLALESKVNIAFGSDFYLPIETLGIPFIKGVLSSLYSLNDFGLSIEQTLRAATKNAAALLGNRKYGEIKKGMDANLVVVHSDISKDLRKLDDPKMVFLNGKQIKGIK